ncbi:MAG: hypothetical protein ACRD5Z_08675, partial [Bryobacteraceae bacterium]
QGGRGLPSGGRDEDAHHAPVTGRRRVGKGIEVTASVMPPVHIKGCRDSPVREDAEQYVEVLKCVNLNPLMS